MPFAVIVVYRFRT